MAARRRRRRRRSSGLAGPILLLLLIMAAGYIVREVFMQPDRLAAGVNQAAPAIAQAAETNDTLTDLPDDSDLTNPDTLQNEDNDMDANPYETFTYYIAGMLSDYEEYQLAHPEMDTSDVVWRVNAGLNRPFYTEENTVTEANPLLINPYNRLPDDFAPAVLEAIDDQGRTATPETISAFRSMREGANNDGIDIVVQSAYRTFEYQRGLYERAGGDGSVARPAFSEHHTGRALDLWGPDGLLDENAPTETGRWVAAHAYEYGFIVRYTEENQPVTGYIAEPWHITYVGEIIAGEMHNGRYGSLEEYVAKNPDARLP